MARRVRVVDESDSGRNQRFYDPDRRRSMTRAEFVRQIEHGTYDDYHVRVINGVKTPVSNPDKTKSDNLG
jgi:hypothetical protein